MNRRSFMKLPLLAPLSAFGSERSSEYRFHYDHVIGTSLDLVVWLSGPESAAVSRRMADAALAEVDRLSAILSTYNPGSEISRFDRREGPIRSRELAEVLDAYRHWHGRTGGILSARPGGANTPLNVDALGKAYIIDRAAAAAIENASGLDGLLLNIGGDIVVRGRACELAVTDPNNPHDNAEPITQIVLRDAAVATSGIYARGPHLMDARTGALALKAATATVVARNAVTANALATTLCISGAEEGLRLVRQTEGAEALRIERGGAVQRTAGFSRLESFQRIQQPAASGWPAGYEVAISLTLTTPDPRLDRSFAAFWVEDPSGKLIRTIVLWGNQIQYHPEMLGLWRITNGDKSLIFKVTRATRSPGAYKVVWNGMDDNGKPVPMGTYRIVVETNRYHGTYAKASGLISCEDRPANISLEGSINFSPVAIQYGPRAVPA